MQDAKETLERMARRHMVPRGGRLLLRYLRIPKTAETTEKGHCQVLTELGDTTRNTQRATKTWR